MIILDTGVLRSAGLDSGSDLLRAIRHTEAHGVAVPWMALEELVSQKAIPYMDKHRKAVEACKAVIEATPWLSMGMPPPLDLKRIRAHWRDVYKEIVQVIPTSDSALREAIFREANRVPPCGDKKGIKTGARDAAIWLSAVEYARENPEETVYFVSGNTGDFGDGESYPLEMWRDIQALGDRFVHFTKLDDVFARFTERTDVDEERVRLALSSTSSREAATTMAGDFEGYTASRQDGERVVMSALAACPALWFRSFRDVEAYRIGKGEWCTATVRWLAAAFIDRGTAVAFAWDTRVLITLTDDDPHLSVLRTIDVGPAEGEDLAAIPNKHWFAEATLMTAFETRLHQLMGSSGRTKDALAVQALSELLNERGLQARDLYG